MFFPYAIMKKDIFRHEISFTGGFFMIYGVNAVNTANNTTNTTATSAVSGNFSSYLGESQTLDSIFQKAADTYQVPVNLLKAIGKAESGFDANAVSKCGAQGIMQLMPSTAASLGVTNSFDPEQNIMGGAKYISQLLNQYNGNVSYALAAYNAGSGNVAKYGGIPPFEETQNYVVKVTGYMNQGVEVPNVSCTSSTTSAASSSPVVLSAAEEVTENINDVFSFTYEDYLEFIMLFEKLLSSESKEEENSRQTQEDSVYDFYASSKMPSLNLTQMLDLI